MLAEIRQRTNNNYHWLIPIALFGLTMLVFWPGIISPDALSQYGEAKAGIFSDHHPPVMAFVWGFLDKFYLGPGLMWGLHLVLLYGATALLVYLFRDSKFKWLYAFFPLIPHIATYSFLLVKDLSFAYSYLLAGVILAYLAKVKESINIHAVIKLMLLVLVILLLFYGTAAKFQAKWILFPFTLCAVYVINSKWSYKTVIYALALFLIILTSVTQFNNWLVPTEQKSNSWQLVKLYDLAAISIKVNQPIFPGFILDNPNFSMEKIKANFRQSEVDSLAFVKDSPLIKTQIPEQQQELVNLWYQAIYHYPLEYLSHRLKLWSYNINTAPCCNSHPYHFFQHTKLKSILELPIVFKVTGWLYSILLLLLRFVWLLPLTILYLYLSIVSINKTRAAIPLLLFSSSSLILLLVLLFCSMAGTARYVYACCCFVHASHGFAYLCMRRKFSYD